LHSAERGEVSRGFILRGRTPWKKKGKKLDQKDGYFFPVGRRGRGREKKRLLPTQMQEIQSIEGGEKRKEGRTKSGGERKVCGEHLRGRELWTREGGGKRGVTCERGSYSPS